MSALILDEAQVTENLPMAQCIEAMAAVLAARARGEASMPLRQVVRGAGAAGLLGLMPGHRGGEEPLYSLKAVCVFPGNPRLGLDAHQGIVALFDGETGRPTAILNGSAVTAIKKVLKDAIAAGGSTLRDHAQATGDPGNFQHHFLVYGREGLKCKGKCPGTVKRIVQSGRSSFYCPRCQK